MLAFMLIFTTAFAQAAAFAPGQVLTAGALNTAFAQAQITSGTIDGATIGSASPSAATFTSIYSMSPDAFGYNYTAKAYGGVTGVPNASMSLMSARGTSAVPTATQAGDVIGNIDFSGYGTASSYTASIDAVAGGVYSATSWPSQFVFNTTAVNSIVPATAMTVANAGVAITGTLSAANGINSTAIGAITASTGAFTAISATGVVTANAGISSTGTATLANVTTSGINTTATLVGTGYRTTSTGVGINTTAAVAAVTIAGTVSSTYIATPAAAVTITLRAPIADGDRTRVCFGAATTVTWAVTAPAIATAGLPAAIALGQCVEARYVAVAGVPINAAATTWYIY